MLKFLKDFLYHQAASGILLMVVAVCALIAANSPLAPHYDAFLAWQPGWDVWRLPLSVWINDGLMTLFFLVVGLEIKSEIIEGELSSRSRAMLPVSAAIGGIVAPALIYAFFNAGTADMRGWAIPTATDIAFSLGVLSLFGKRISPALTVFLMALAVMDDLVAVLIIAAFYTEALHFGALMIAMVCLLLLLACNRQGIPRLWVYIAVGFFLWVSIFVSGIHPTIAGVLLGCVVPLRMGSRGLSPGKRLIKALHPWVAYLILPLFAFCNAGIPLAGLSFDAMVQPVPLGIALGLFLGKQTGIFGVAWLLVQLGLARLPSQTSWLEFYAVSLLAGIGFTMSLFIGLLAFPHPDAQLAVRLGVVVGSLLSVVAGVVAMKIAIRRKAGRL